MKKIFTIIFYFSIFSCYSQELNVFSIWNSIITELNIPEDYHYYSIESAISSDRITAEISKITNRHDAQFTDFIFYLNFGNYRKTIYFSGYSSIYFLTGVEIYINEYEEIKELFPDYTMEQFISDENFGTIIEMHSNDRMLAYEIDKDNDNTVWNYLLIVFENGRIDEIRLRFRLD